jgi:hypothetical protein
MTTENDDQPRAHGPEHSQRLLIMAYCRLMLLPEQADGTSATRITTAGNYELRLREMARPERADVCSLLVELFDHRIGRLIDSQGCRDLNEAGTATECFLAMVQKQDTAVALSYFDPLTGQFVEIPHSDGRRHRT